MNIVAYIAVSGTEPAIEQFHATTGGGIKKSFRAAIDEGARSLWRTNRHALDPNDIERSIDNYLAASKSVIRQIQECRAQFAEAYLMLVVRYDDGESPRGFSLSPEAIRVLAELGAAFEIDVVTVLDETLP